MKYLRQRSKVLQKSFPCVYAGNVAHSKIMKLWEILEHCSLKMKVKVNNISVYISVGQSISK